MLCKDKLDSVLTRLKEEVQKYVNHVLQLQGFQQQAPGLDPDGILQKVNQKGQRITAVQGTVLQKSCRNHLQLSLQTGWKQHKAHGPPDLAGHLFTGGTGSGSHLLNQILC